MTEKATGPKETRPAQRSGSAQGDPGGSGGARRIGKVRRSLMDGLDEEGRRRVDTLFDILLRKAEALAKQYPDGLPDDLEGHRGRARRDR